MLANMITVPFPAPASPKIHSTGQDAQSMIIKTVECDLNCMTILPIVALPVVPSTAITIFGVGLHSIAVAIYWAVPMHQTPTLVLKMDTKCYKVEKDTVLAIKELRTFWHGNSELPFKSQHDGCYGKRQSRVLWQNRHYDGFHLRSPEEFLQRCS